MRTLRASSMGMAEARSIFTSSAVRSPMSMLNSRLMWLMMASSIFAPPTGMDWLTTKPPRDTTAASVVPPPISTTMEPMGSYTGRLEPSAAAKGFSTR